MSDLLSARAFKSGGRYQHGGVVVEAETADAAREKIERRGYFASKSIETPVSGGLVLGPESGFVPEWRAPCLSELKRALRQ